MRKEYKYVVRTADLLSLRERLRPYLTPDPLAKTNGGGYYTVRSIYYDTASLQFYREKVEGLAQRRKVRVRVYNEKQKNSLAFLEIKRKDREFIFKTRAPVPVEDLDLLFSSGDAEHLVAPLQGFPHAVDHARNFLFHLRASRLLSTSLVTYDREAYQCRYDTGLRITFDMNLRCSLRPSLEEIWDEELLEPSMQGFAVLEVKFFRGLPSWLKHVIEERGLRRQAVSKYCIGLDVCGVENATRSVV